MHATSDPAMEFPEILVPTADRTRLVRVPHRGALVEIENAKHLQVLRSHNISNAVKIRLASLFRQLSAPVYADRRAALQTLHRFDIDAEWERARAEVESGRVLQTLADARRAAIERIEAAGAPQISGAWTSFRSGWSRSAGWW